MNEPTSDARPDPPKPYVSPEIDELGDIDDHTYPVSGYFAEPGAETRPGPHLRR
ncbi:MAG: hypothetical protein M3155_00050 [Actinomycetota bacterium]|nr:hypothetical protein [Actinomycetota bacterium]